jgi:hypothetical protein
MLHQLFNFLVVTCWAVAPARTTRACVYAIILLYAVGVG